MIAIPSKTHSRKLFTKCSFLFVCPLIVSHDKLLIAHYLFIVERGWLDYAFVDHKFVVSATSHLTTNG